MIKYIFSALLLLLFTQKSYSQCDNEFTITCKKAFNLKDGERVEEINMEATITFTKESITLTASYNGEQESLLNNITETAICDWKKFMENGAMKFLVATQKHDDGDEKNSIVTIESKEGETTVTFAEAAQNEGNSGILFIADSYEVTKQSTPTTEGVSKKSRKEKQIVYLY